MRRPQHLPVSQFRNSSGRQLAREPSSCAWRGGHHERVRRVSAAAVAFDGDGQVRLGRRRLQRRRLRSARMIVRKRSANKHSSEQHAGRQGTTATQKRSCTDRVRGPALRRSAPSNAREQSRRGQCQRRRSKAPRTSCTQG